MNARFFLAAAIVAIAGAGIAAAQAPSLTYLGRSTVKLVTADGFVVYVDPYGNGDYSQAADLLLVTHGHSDHAAVGLVTLKPTAVVASPAGAVSVPGSRAVKEGDEFAVGPVTVKVVPAYNKNHYRDESVGFVIMFDGLSVYHAGDTSYIAEMASLASMGIDYALLPTDGYYNMDGVQAGKCYDAIKPRFVLPIHSSPERMFDRARAAKLVRPGAIILEPGMTITLESN